MHRSVFSRTGRQLLSVLIISAIFLGCTKKEEVAPIICTVLSSTTTTGGTTLTTTNHYNDAGQLISAVTTGPGSTVVLTTTYSYNSNGDLESMTSSSDVQEISQTFTYDGLRRMSTRTLSVGLSTYISTWEYNNSNQYISLVETETFDGCTDCPHITTTTFSYPNALTHNASASVTTGYKGSSSSTFTYDSKKMIPSTAAIAPQPDNNISKIVITTGSTTLVINYTYIYNAQSYPTSISISGDVDELTLTYDYSCK